MPTNSAVLACELVYEAITVLGAQCSLYIVYSCFDKGCPKKAYATMSKGSLGNTHKF